MGMGARLYQNGKRKIIQGTRKLFGVPRVQNGNTSRPALAAASVNNFKNFVGVSQSEVDKQ
jgi:hypothetical protein